MAATLKAAGPVLCFGEMLWDVLPDGAHPGGAPFNVAYHLHQLGIPVLPVSAVGRDAGGRDLLRRLEGWGISTAAVVTDPSAPTGTVTVTLGANGDARYEIAENVAWDYLPEDTVPGAAARGAAGLVFGTLALRSPGNRRTLRRLADEIPAAAWRVFDVNLRAPFDEPERVREFAPLARVLKVNADEALRLVGGAAVRPPAEELLARRLHAAFGAEFICVTAAGRGAGLLQGGAWSWCPGRPVQVADTVGAGDAFLAALLAGLLAGPRHPLDVVTAACRLGEWVAAHAGATPPYDPTTPRAAAGS